MNKFWKSPYFITALFGVAAVSAYVFLPTVKQKAAAPVSSDMTATATTSAFDIKAYLQKINTHFTNQDTLRLLEVWSEEQNYNALVAVYHQKGESVAEAYYSDLAARKTGNGKLLERAGDLFGATSAISNTEAMQTYLVEKAVSAYEGALAADTANIPLQMKLAGMYIEQGTNPMVGITMLLDIVKNDPDNTDAQLMLGKFAMMSGQFEKAVQRLEKVIYLRPRSNDVLFLLAIAHENNGNKQKALELLELCKQQEQNQDLKREISSYIDRLKQSL